MARDERDTGQSDEDEVKVTDRRLFTAEGELRSGAVEAEEAQEAEAERRSADTSRRRAGSSAEDEGFERRPVEEPQGVDFTMLINAMAEPALLFLGEIAHPSTGQPQVDLERARIQIDMLDLLRVKCRGNLNAEEEGLLDRILYQLRMLFVSRSNQPQA